MLETLDKQLVVTVPAVWSERAKDQTLKAVTKAKWAASKISLVSEPEAAAIYTLKGMTEGANRAEVRVGDNFVL
jgi:molecular chaperone DnaK (HSP70)